jgi:hypothetical protein
MENDQKAQQHEYRILGLSRSGNHAVINWVISQLEGEYVFLNCTEPKHNPFLTCRPLALEGDSYLTNKPDFDLEKEQKGSLTIKDYLIYNHEDSFLGSLNSAAQQKARTQWVGQSKLQKDVLILRDPFNLFASRIKAGLIRGHYTHHGARPISTLTLKRIYKQHAHEFLGNRKNLKNKILVNFNLWTSNMSYREDLARQLDIPFRDSGFTEVPAVAGGSSFDGITFAGKANEMRLQDRWRAFEDDEEYWKLFDEEIVDLTEQIFGKIEPVVHYNQSLRVSKEAEE